MSTIRDDDDDIHDHDDICHTPRVSRIVLHFILHDWTCCLSIFYFFFRFLFRFVNYWIWPRNLASERACVCVREDETRMEKTVIEKDDVRTMRWMKPELIPIILRLFFSIFVYCYAEYFAFAKVLFSVVCLRLSACESHNIRRVKRKSTHGAMYRTESSACDLLNFQNKWRFSSSSKIRNLSVCIPDIEMATYKRKEKKNVPKHFIESKISS